MRSNQKDINKKNSRNVRKNTREISRNKKRNLKKQNPRYSGQTGLTGEKQSTDKITVFLGITAVILIVLILVFLDRNTVTAITGRRTGVKQSENNQPEIIRVEKQEPQKENSIGRTETNIGTPGNQKENTEKQLLEDNAKQDTPNISVRLFFIKVNDEGEISLKSVLRQIDNSETPLSSAVNELLKGPGPGELSSDVLSLIPEGSRLLGARIENGIAYLNFNEQFRFNNLGLEGYKAQLEQIVYTTTEFSTVNKVQILIEGQKVDYLGGEGFPVGKPLGRESFADS